MWVNAGRALFIALLFSCRGVSAISLDELRHRPKLTPEEFASCFENFEFVFHEEIQNPEVFLATQSGDCDDYATLAATILREKGYTTRLIAVRMPEVVHVVCYIEESHCYLDYNERHSPKRIVQAGPSIAEIAQKVSKSFKTSWRSASEFTFSGGEKRLVSTVMETGHRGLFGRETFVASAPASSLQR